MKQGLRYRIPAGFALLLAEMGISPSRTLELAELPADIFEQDGSTLSGEQYYMLCLALQQEATGIEIPLKFAEAFSAELFDPPIFAYFCSPNLTEALRRLQRFKPLVGPMSLKLDITEESTKLQIVYEDFGIPVPAFLPLFELVFFTQMIRVATRHHVIPIEIETHRTITNEDQYEAYFGKKVHQGHHTGITFSAKDASRPFLTQNNAMWAFFEPLLQKQLAEQDDNETIQHKVKRVFLELLPSGSTTIDNVAGQLAMSKRTLQRKLSQESVTYQDVLNETRKELALHYLSSSSISLTEVAYLLGFHETTSFYRAFSNWTGTTPEQYRVTVEQE